MTLIRPTLAAVAIAILLLVLRFAGFLPALVLCTIAAAIYIARRLFAPSSRMEATPEPLDGISLHIENKLKLRRAWSTSPHVEQLEIGATGPGELQFVLISTERRATLKLSAEQARWLAGALNHWADSSETIALH
jgi:hypothetical protein